MLMRKLVIGILILCSLASFAQMQDSIKPEGWEKMYRASATKINDLVHTRLDVSFDYSKSWMYGKAWITLHPHFYATDSLNLDAKRMEIKEVSILKSGKHIPLKYVYDSLNLRITLDKTYKGGENYTVFIDYIAKPEDFELKGDISITNNKGLFFINPLGKDKNKPTQIWTQGESESNSGWFPTIDKPNQKTTDEISMTVQDKYKTLSNGVLVSQKKHADGTRTDTWKMDLPHAPYLMSMVVGEYFVIMDNYKGKEVSYYVEKEYAPVARKIFGLTPEMIAYFSRITGIDYPWNKYAQIVVRNFVAGAMENTSATTHAEVAQQDARQLIDGNSWESVIAHELFHQWFGDYVTTESWSNITLNESFADLSETLWDEYKYGKDAGGEHNYNGMQDYFQSGKEKNDLVRFYYKDKFNMFDEISYQKGGRILNMLRNYVGDSAFFKSLNLYLRTKKFQSAEAQDLRLAFEEVTGEDLNWFWNQWYYGSGHPKLDINYDYDANGKTAKVFIKQTQPDKVFKFKLAVDVYQGADKKRYYVWVDKATDTLIFTTTSKPDLINVDGDKILLCEKTDHKTMDNFIFQYNKAGLYLDRHEAIDFGAENQLKDPKAMDLLKTAMKDKYNGLRIYALQRLDFKNDTVKNMIEPLLVDLAKNDPNSLVRAGALEALAKYKKDSYKEFFLKSINDSSYSVAGYALFALGKIDSVAALNKAKVLSTQKVKGELFNWINYSLYTYANESEFDFLAARFDNLPSWNAKFQTIFFLAKYLKRVNNATNFKKGIDMIVNFRDSIQSQNGEQIMSYINGFILNSIATSKQSSGMIEQADYVFSKLPAISKSQTTFEVPIETLHKYTGNYNSSRGEILKLVLKEDKTLNLLLPDGQVMILQPVSKNKFSVKYMDGLTIEFVMDERGEVTDMLFASPNGKDKAIKTK